MKPSTGTVIFLLALFLVGYLSFSVYAMLMQARVMM